jgi:hypothetical protein
MVRLSDRVTDRARQLEYLKKLERFRGYRAALADRYRDPGYRGAEHAEGRGWFWAAMADANESIAEIRAALGLPADPARVEIPADVDVAAARASHREYIAGLQQRHTARSGKTTDRSGRIGHGF